MDVRNQARVRSARVAWSLRTYGWLVVVCALLFAAGGLVAEPINPSYQSSALVVAREIAVEREVLPRLGSAVFNSGPVARAVADLPAVDGDVEGLIPERLSVVAAEDSVVFVVQARDPDPGDAAELANAAAAAFVVELNRGGAGVGEFALQGAAVVPSQTVTDLGPAERAALGAAGGTILGLGLIALLAALRRPVLSSDDVEKVAGVPLLGTLQMAFLSPKAHPGQFAAEGLATVIRRLAAVPDGRLLLTSPRSAAAIRRRVYVLAAAGLGMLRPVRLDAQHDLVEAAEIHRRALEEARTDRPAPPQGVEELVLADEDAGPAMVDPARTRLSVVAIARRGVSRRRLRALTSGYIDGEVMGVVLVDVRPGMERAAARRAGTATPPGGPRPTSHSGAKRSLLAAPTAEPT